jgi:hypothetical protein
MRKRGGLGSDIRLGRPDPDLRAPGGASCAIQAALLHESHRDATRLSEPQQACQHIWLRSPLEAEGNSGNGVPSGWAMSKTWTTLNHSRFASPSLPSGMARLSLNSMGARMAMPFSPLRTHRPQPSHV